MRSASFAEFIKVINKYSECYKLFEGLQKNEANDFIPTHGDQKTGIIGESFVFEFLKRKGEKNLKFGGASNKTWDISYTKNGKTILVQVKTVSAYSKTRVISPIHYGWDEIYFISLDYNFLPIGLWRLEKNSVENIWPTNKEGEKKKIESKKMPSNDLEKTSDIFFKKSKNEILLMLELLKEIPRNRPNHYQEKLQMMSNEKLISCFNKEINNPGWTGKRAEYLSAIHREFNKRNFDYSLIGNKKKLSFNQKIKLVNKKIIKKT